MTAATDLKPPQPKRSFADFVSRFTVLRGAIRELWLIFGIKLLNIAAYNVVNLTLVLWLRSEFGYSDPQALGLVAVWSTLFTVVTILVGPLTDALGFRRTLFIGVSVCIASRLLMGLSSQPVLALVCGLTMLAIGEALGTPVLVAGVRRYSTTTQRSISFSLFYMIMNLGFFVSAFIFDKVRKGLGEVEGITIPGLGWHCSTYRALFLVSLLLELCLLPLIYFLRPAAEAAGESTFERNASKTLDPGPNETPGYERETSGIRRAVKITIASAVRTIHTFKALVGQQGFYRLLGFLVLIAFLKLIFKQMDYAYPTFMIRELGPGVPLGRLSGINNLVIILLVPIVGVLTQRFRAYSMVIFGGCISALSVFIMTLPLSWFNGLADSLFGRWLGQGYLGLSGAVHPYYLMVFLFIIVLSLGESFYSPRVYEYAAAIAPKGQEASYSALSYIPFILPKLMVGTISGFLLAKYCPAEGPRRPEIMWLVIALLTTVAPVGLMALRRFLRVPEAGRENDG